MYNRKNLIVGLFFFGAVGAFTANGQQVVPKNEKPQLWLTDPDQGVLFKQEAVQTSARQNNLPEITISPAKKYQQMDGFGFALTGGSAMLINKMSPDKQAVLLRELYGTGKNDIGASYLRVSIGASDLDDHVFSYNDLPGGGETPS